MRWGPRSGTLAAMSPRYTFALVAVVAALAAVAVSAIGYASIPSTGGTISACKQGDGSIRLIDKQAGESCAGTDQLVEWNKGVRAKALANRFGADTGGAAFASGAECTLGQVLLTASPAKTAGGLPANGQLLPIAENEALFQLLGTTYGGDGEVTFRLPDLRPVAPDHMTYSICVFGAFPTS